MPTNRQRGTTMRIHICTEIRKETSITDRFHVTEYRDGESGALLRVSYFVSYRNLPFCSCSIPLEISFDHTNRDQDSIVLCGTKVSFLVKGSGLVSKYVHVTRKHDGKTIDRNWSEIKYRNGVLSAIEKEFGIPVYTLREKFDGLDVISAMKLIVSIATEYYKGKEEKESL